MNEPLEELACLYVLDQLEAGDRAAFEARLLREPELAAYVRDLEPALAHGVKSLPPREPPAATFARIEKRIAAGNDSRGSPAAGRAVRAARPRLATFARWGIAAVITVSLATIAVQSLRHASTAPMIVFVGMNADQNTFAELPLRESGKDADARFIQLASLAENYWEKPANLPIKPDASSGDRRGYALFDPGSQQGFIAIEQLPPIAENQRYHLWVVEPASGRIRDAGTLPLSGLNRGLYSFTLSTADVQKSDRPNIFVTVEENTAVPQSTQPRGKVVLGHQPI
jgi:anti-sigma-K factor RskA